MAKIFGKSDKGLKGKSAGKPSGNSAGDPRGNATTAKGASAGTSSKTRARETEAVPFQDRIEEEGRVITSNQGIVASDNHNSLKAGVRGPTLLEDFFLREKITSFDHERIPERVVHARGVGAFGYFECTKDMSKYTTAGLLTQVGKRTPVMTRISTVGGSRGSADTARDVRGFAVKFYSDEGNWDLVGNNIPVFFIQDAVKFPDLIHAAKPEQDREIPQAQTAHDTFWDFMSLMPESLHMAMWIMSDRTLPRSLRMMEGFGVHTFRFLNAKGEATFVKFHWKPKFGVHSMPWEESQMLGGLDPDFHRRDIFESIENEAFPEWELGVQLVPEKDEFKFPFDLLDPTKLIPEELVPVEIIGKMVLNRNPENYFAEVEQVAFCPANLVPGIDLSNDPLLQGRLFSYLDTQLTRLGGPNFHEIPVNRPIAPVHNNNRDGFGRQMIPKGKVAYEPNSLKGGCPFHAAMKGDPQSFVSATERMSGHKVRARSKTFDDFHSQAKLFYDSQTPVEQQHIKDAFTFELSKVETPAVRQRQVELLMMVNMDLASEIAQNLGLKLPNRPSIAPSPDTPDNDVVPANRSTKIAMADSDEIAWTPKVKLPGKSAALSMIGTFEPIAEGRKVGLLITAKSDFNEVDSVKTSLEAQGLAVELVVPKLGVLPIGKEYPEDERALNGQPSHSYDAIWVMTSADGYEKPQDVGLAIRFVGQAFKHCKPIAGTKAGLSLIDRATFGLYKDDAGVIVNADSTENSSKGSTKSAVKDGKGKVSATTAKSAGGSLSTNLVGRFVESIAGHRHWEREMMAKELPY